MSSDIDTMLSYNNSISLDIDSTSSNSSIYDECPICLEDLVRSIATTNCGHQFHFECLSNWIYSQKKIVFTCPSCNKNPCEIINVHSNKKSVSKLDGIDKVDTSTLLEISNLENTSMERMENTMVNTMGNRSQYVRRNIREGSNMNRNINNNNMNNNNINNNNMNNNNMNNNINGRNSNNLKMCCICNIL